MVRGVQILLILTVFRHAITASVFDQFNSPEKKDKNKMLMYLRGLLKGPTTVKVITKQTAVTLAPGSVDMEQLWDGNNLPDRSDKSKMLAYLRGIKAPNSMFSVYEDPQHRGLIQTLETTENKQNTDDNQEPVDLSDRAQQIAWKDPDMATHAPYLPPVYYKEGDSDTCFWRSQQSGGQHKLVKGVTTTTDKTSNKDKGNKDDNKNKKDKTTDVEKGFEDVGDSITKFFNCANIKFWKSYNKIQKKICGMFEG